MKRIAVFASGGGTDFQSVIDANERENFCEIKYLIASKDGIGESFISAFKDRIINIHPSLIPAFCGAGYYGLKVHKAVIDYGAKISGCTVHFVNEIPDGGAIIAQTAVTVEECDTAESLQQKILEKEHKLLPWCVKKLCQGKIEKTGRKVVIKQ